MSKYVDLKQHLMNRRDPVWEASFDEVEAILGFSLPKSARKYQAWWSNTEHGHSHAQSWLEAGWKTEGITMSGSRVTFRKVDGQTHAKDKKTTSVSLFGLLPGKVRVLLGFDLTEPTDVEWSAASE